MIVFQNPGLIDLTAVTTLGVNVKENDSPIGYFGTGLKFAIAVLLRNSQNITIYRGAEAYSFASKAVDVRGKPFQVVTMNGQELGFTTALGRNWGLQQAYRELYSNCIDEGGEIFEGIRLEGFPSDRTTIVVDGLDFAVIHQNRGEFILPNNLELLFKTKDMELYFRPSKSIFYRGIAVYDIAHNPSPHFTYNIIRPSELTEDRTLKDWWNIDYLVADLVNALSESPEEAHKIALRGLILPHEKSFEKQVSWALARSPAPTPALRKLVREFSRHRGLELNATLLQAVNSNVDIFDHVEFMRDTETRRKQFWTAVWFCTLLGFPVGEYPIKCVERLSGDNLGMAYNGTIYITALAFEKGTKCVASTLIEEFIHLRDGVRDCTRRMQDVLIDRMVSIGEEYVWKDPL